MWEYDSGESDLELTSHPLCGHRKGIRFLFFYKWLYFNFISTKVSRCCFIEQHFIIFRKFPSSKSFLSSQNTKEVEEGVDEARHYCIPYQIFKFILSLFYIKLNYYFFFKEVDKGVVGKGKNKTCRANLSTLIWLLCKVMIISLFLVPSYLVFCLKQVYFAGCSPRLKVVYHGSRCFHTVLQQRRTGKRG